MQPTLSQWLKRKPTSPKARKGLKRSGRVRPVSAKRRRQARAYSLLREAYLKVHPFCQVKMRRLGPPFTEEAILAHAVGLNAENCQGVFFQGQLFKIATDIHHTKGRTGGNYLNTDTWLSACREEHDWVHSHPKEARALGLLY
jgi:hypothetical protein